MSSIQSQNSTVVREFFISFVAFSIASLEYIAKAFSLVNKVIRKSNCFASLGIDIVSVHNHTHSLPFFLSPLAMQAISLPLLCRKHSLWFMTDDVVVLLNSYSKVIVNAFDLTTSHICGGI